MDKGTLVPFALFFCITYAFKITLDAVMRYRMLREPGTEHLLQSILQGEQAQRRLASLRWGILLMAIAVGFTVIEILDVHRVTPGAIAILLACTGTAHLIYFALARRLT